MKTPIEKTLKNYFLNKKPEMIRMLGSIVNINSQTYCKKGVDFLGQLMAKKIAEVGFNIETIKQKELGNQIIAKKGSRVKSRILIMTHLDTALLGGKEGYPFRIKNNNIALGAGIADMKGSLVQIYGVLKALQDLKIINKGSITVFFNSDEEIGSLTSRKRIEEEAKSSEFCLVLEPARANGALVIERKGSAIFEMNIKGIPAHCGIEPQKGVSAIEELAKKIILLHKLTNYKSGTTVNVGYISGGVARNLIADSAHAKIDVRIKTKKEADEIIHKIREIAKRKLLKGTQTEIIGDINRPPMVRTSKSDKLIDIAQEKSKKLGIKISFVSTGGVSDGNFVSALGIPTLDGLGLIGGKLCTPDEYVLLDSIVERSAFLTLIIQRLLS
jgi:glutamate carboxypeptidase